MTTIPDAPGEPDMIGALLAAVLEQDSDQCADLCMHLFDGCDTTAGYEICRKIAATAKAALTELNKDALALPPDGTGAWSIDHVRCTHPGIRTCAFGWEFLAAYCAGDDGTTRALHDQLAEQGLASYMNGVAALCNQVACAAMRAHCHQANPGAPWRPAAGKEQP